MALIDKLTAIANEIRHLTGTQKKLTLADMEIGVAEVYDKGQAAGGQLGREAAKREFWQNIPNMTQKYLFAGPAWNVHTFYPEKSYHFSGNLTDYMFAFHGSSSEPYDMAERLASCGVEFDYSGVTRANFMFYNTGFTKLPFMDLSGCSKLSSTFAYSRNLHSIAGLHISEDTDFDRVFQQCIVLENLAVTGCIGKSGLDVSECPLSHDSLMSILNALKTGVSGLTLTLGADNLGRLTDSEKAIAANKGWQLQ